MMVAALFQELELSTATYASAIECDCCLRQNSFLQDTWRSGSVIDARTNKHNILCKHVLGKGIDLKEREKELEKELDSFHSHLSMTYLLALPNNTW